MSSIRDIVLIIKDVSQIASDLIKCQAQQLRYHYKELMTRMLAWVLMVLTAIMLAIGGLGMIVWAVYHQLSVITGPAASAYILGAFLLLLAIIVFLFARTILKE